MARRIILVRHGRSGHVHRGWMNLEQFRVWREAYEAAGIAADEMPPASLRDTAAAARMLAASDAPRAIASAQRLAPGRDVTISPLLRELDLHPPNLGPLRLPFLGWALAIGIKGAVTPEETERARDAASWLASIAEGTVVAVTHGSVRRIIARELLKMGWRPDPSSRAIRHWSAWAFTAP